MGENGFRNNEMREFTGFRVATKDRVFTNAAKHKGMTYKIGQCWSLFSVNQSSLSMDCRRLRAYHKPRGSVKTDSCSGVSFFHPNRVCICTSRLIEHILTGWNVHQRSAAKTHGHSLLVFPPGTGTPVFSADPGLDLQLFLKTVHQPTHLFYEDEVFKTGHMVDHPVEDIIERVGCQFYAKVR